jgi:hypothetical protein
LLPLVEDGPLSRSAVRAPLRERRAGREGNEQAPDRGSRSFRSRPDGRHLISGIEAPSQLREGDHPQQPSAGRGPAHARCRYRAPPRPTELPHIGMSARIGTASKIDTGRPNRCPPRSTRTRRRLVPLVATHAGGGDVHMRHDRADRVLAGPDVSHHMKEWSTPGLLTVSSPASALPTSGSSSRRWTRGPRWCRWRYRRASEPDGVRPRGRRPTGPRRAGCGRRVRRRPSSRLVARRVRSMPSNSPAQPFVLRAAAPLTQTGLGWPHETGPTSHRGDHRDRGSRPPQGF